MMMRILLLMMISSLGCISSFAGNPNALVRLSVACVRENPGHASELGTQILMGHPVEIVTESNGWCEVRTIDGYHGYVINHSLVKMESYKMTSWQHSPRVVYTALTQGTVVSDTLSMTPVSDIVPGCIVGKMSSYHKWIKVLLPDGRSGYLPSESLTDITDWAIQPFDAGIIIDYAKKSIGIPYLWGGTSCKAMDCSGLTWIGCFLNGRILPRNASAQGKLPYEHISVSDTASMTPGVLMFFGNIETGRINHVAVHISDGDFIESSQLVRRNSLNQNSPDYHEEQFLYAININRLPPIAELQSGKWIFGDRNHTY